jgi:hypothetical protein
MIAKDYNIRLNRQNGAHSTLCWHLRQLSIRFDRGFQATFKPIEGNIFQPIKLRANLFRDNSLYLSIYRLVDKQ